MPRRLSILLVVLVLVAGAAVLRWSMTPKPGPGREGYLAGVKAAEAGATDAAAQSLQQAILLEPENGDYHAELGGVYLQAGRYDEAVAALQSAAFLSPNRPHVYCQLAQGLVETRRRADALQALDEALRRSPECPHALAVRGEQFLRDDNLKEALPAFQRLIELQPEFVLGYQKAGFLLLATHQIDEAVKVLEKGLTLAPAHPGMHALLGEAYQRRPRDPQAEHMAIQHFRAALRNNPEAAKAHAALGKLYLRRNDLDGARKELEQALALQPSLAEARYTLSQVAGRSGRRAEAARHLKLYEELQEAERQLAELQARALARPGDVEIHLQVVRLALQHRIPGAAERSLEAAVQADPANAEVRRLRSQLFLLQGKERRAAEELAVASRLPSSGTGPAKGGSTLR